MRHWLLHLCAPASDSGWNVITFGSSGLANLVDDTGAATSLSASIDPAVTNYNTVGTGSSTRYPADITTSSLFTSADGFPGGPPLYTLTLSGLDPSKLYDFTLYASRAGVADVRTTLYAIGSASAVLDAANNIDNVVTLLNIATDPSGAITLTWQGDPATNTNPSRFGYLSVVDFTEKNPPPLVSGTASFTSATATTVSLTGTAATGGVGNYTYQWHRSMTGGFTPSSGTLLAGATALSLADATAVAGVLYFYRLVAGDASGSVTSNEVMGALNVPTAPLPISFHHQLLLGYIGSSTWAIDTGSGTIPDLIRTNLLAINSSAIISTVNGAVGGTTSSDWIPGQANFNNFKSIVQAVTGGFKILRLMIGSNDAAAGRATAAWLANVQAIVDDAQSWVDLIIVEEIGVRLDGGDATINLIAQYNAARSSLTGAKVRLGSAYTLANQATHLSNLSGDNIHQNQAGSIATAQEQAAELASAVTPVAPAINGRIAVRPNGNAGTITISIVTTASSPSPIVFTFDENPLANTFVLGAGIVGGGIGTSRLALDL